MKSQPTEYFKPSYVVFTFFSRLSISVDSFQFIKLNIISFKQSAMHNLRKENKVKMKFLGI